MTNTTQESVLIRQQTTVELLGYLTLELGKCDTRIHPEGGVSYDILIAIAACMVTIAGFTI